MSAYSTIVHIQLSLNRNPDDGGKESLQKVRLQRNSHTLERPRRLQCIFLYDLCGYFVNTDVYMC